MGKNKKKDPAKKAALQAKKDAKADKAARKRAKKETTQDAEEAADVDPDASLDDLLNLYRKKDIAGTKPIVETLEGFPPPRGNFTMTVVEGGGNKQEVYVFGGEYFDGVVNIVVDHLLKWTHNPKTNDHEWKQITTPSGPPARCAHSTVYYNNALYVFGGELATADHYHHYKDTWRYDISTQTWRELTAKVGTLPSARSGHSAIVWKHYMVVFGGFYEAMKDVTPRWFNDVYVMDLKTEQWMEVPHSKLGNRPEPRSACNCAVVGDDKICIQGGFSKLSAAAAGAGKETKVHTDAWILNLKPILQGKPPTWEKLLSSSGATSGTTNHRNPNGRSACASATYKNKMLVFGGVVDAEMMHHKVDSVFFHDLFCLEAEPRPKWYPLKVRKQPQQQQQQQQEEEVKQEEEEEEEDDNNMEIEEDAEDDNNPQPTGWSIDQLRENMFAFTDGAGNLVYEKFGAANKVSDGESDEEKEETKEEEEESKQPEKRSSQKKKDMPDPNSTTTITSSSVMVLDPNTNTPQAVQRDEPLPRIKCGAIVNKNTLFIYGGLVEIGDREVTLDDMWSLDLKKRSQWKCLFPGTMHKQVWRGAVHDDDDSYISTGAGDDDEDDSDDEEEKEESKQAEMDPEVAELNEKYDLNNSLRTPKDGEALADFYARTKSYWNEQAAEVLKGEGSEEPTNKELKREGFQLARKRFEELEPIIDRLKELTVGGGDKEDAKSSKKEKKSKKKKK